MASEGVQFSTDLCEYRKCTLTVYHKQVSKSNLNFLFCLQTDFFLAKDHSAYTQSKQNDRIFLNT